MSAKCARCAAWSASFRPTPLSWWAATSRPSPASSSCSTPTTSSRATASPGCAEYLGEDPAAPIRHPALISGFDLRVMGVRIPDRADSSATIIASVGCPMGCNFCTTSAFFGGKGKMLNLYSTGEELFRVMLEAEASRHVKSFFIMDENFLLQKRRAMELLDRMKRRAARAGRSTSSPPPTPSPSIDMKSSSSWASPRSGSAWNRRVPATPSWPAPTRCSWPRDLRHHGIVLLGSTIIGLEHHTPANILAEIEHAVAHETDLHQFMLYTPVPGTPLYQRNAGAGPPARCGSGRHPRPGRLQLPPPRHLARGVPAVSRMGLPARLRAERSEPVPHLPHHFRRLEAV